MSPNSEYVLYLMSAISLEQIAEMKNKARQSGYASLLVTQTLFPRNVKQNFAVRLLPESSLKSFRVSVDTERLRWIGSALSLSIAARQRSLTARRPPHTREQPTLLAPAWRALLHVSLPSHRWPRADPGACGVCAIIPRGPTLSLRISRSQSSRCSSVKPTPLFDFLAATGPLPPGPQS